MPPELDIALGWWRHGAHCVVLVVRSGGWLLRSRREKKGPSIGVGMRAGHEVKEGRKVRSRVGH